MATLYIHKRAYVLHRVPRSEAGSCAFMELKTDDPTLNLFFLKHACLHFGFGFSSRRNIHIIHNLGRLSVSRLVT